MIRFKKMPMVLASAGLMSLAGPQLAVAGQVDDLKKMVQQLSVEVKQLKEQQAKQQTQQQAQQTQLAEQAQATKKVELAQQEVKPKAEGATVKAVAPKGAPPATMASVGSAQSPLSITVGGANVTLYGNVDIYMNYMKSSSGGTITALQDGAIQRSRIGFRGDREIADGYALKFQLEQGFNLTNGSAADTASTSSTGRLFDRQAWVGVVTPYGEFRAGRQNTAIFGRGDYIDYGSRTLGSVVNNFGVPSRFDGDLAYISPRIYGFQAEAHYAIAGSTPTNGTTNDPSTIALSNMGVYQLALDYLNGPFRIGYAGIEGRPDQNAKGTRYDQNVEYHNLYANYDYGRGKIYLTGIRSNNGSGALSNVGGNLVANNPQLLTGTNSSVTTYYNIYQISADYKVTPTLRIGGLYGKINDTSDSNKGGSGWSLGGFYDAFQNTTIYALVDSMDNESNGNWRPSGSAGLTKNFSGTDVTGQRINGAQLGFLFKF